MCRTGDLTVVDHEEDVDLTVHETTRKWSSVPVEFVPEKVFSKDKRKDKKERRQTLYTRT